MLIATLTMLAQAGTASAPVAPSGKWIVDYADSMCVLQRDFGEGEGRVTFAVKPDGLRGEGVTIVLARPEAGGDAFRRGRADMAFDRDPAAKVDYQRYRVAAQRMAITQFALEPKDVERLTQAKTMTVPMDGSRSVTLSVDNMRAAVGALDKCQTDLLTSFGVPRADLNAMVIPAKPVTGMANWLMSDDYPRDAMLQSKEGDVLIVWRIGADGRLSDCRTVKSAGFPSLDTAACAALMKRARYQPARNRAGEAIPSWSMRRVIWRLPR